MENGLRKQISLRRKEIIKDNEQELSKIKKLTDAGIVKFYNSKKVESNFHNNFIDLNVGYAKQRREKAHEVAEKCLQKLRERVRNLVD